MNVVRLAPLGIASFLFGCGSSPPPAAPTTDGAPSSTTSTTTSPASSGAAGPASPAPSGSGAAGGGAKEGESCGNGVMGAPNIACAAGLTCDMKNTAPAGPPGAAASARPGVCRPAK